MKQVGKYYRTLADEVYEVLFEAILNQTLAAGRQITLRELSEELHVSTSPVKQAITRLAHQGLVSVDRRDMRIAKLTKKQILDRIDMRLLLESYAVDAGFAKKTITPAFIESLNSLASEFERAISMETTCLADLATKDSAFHLHIVSLADNESLSKWYEGLNLHVHMVIYEAGSTFAKHKGAADEHRSIVGAFQEQSLETVKSILREHISAAKSRIATYRDSD